MAYLLTAKEAQAVMDQSVSRVCNPSSTKIERRLIEKNRRNHMKFLYSNLNSLLPPTSSKEIQTLPDQIDEAINHIKSMEIRLKKLNDKKNSLLTASSENIFNTNRKRPYTASTCTPVPGKIDCVARTLTVPKIEISEIGSVLEVVLVTDVENHFIFYELVRVLSEEQADVVSAKFSDAGDSVFHVVHAEIGESIFGAARISERLRRFVNGSLSEVELQQEWWEDFQGRPDIMLELM